MLFVGLVLIPVVACNNPNNPPAFHSQMGAVKEGDTWYVSPSERFVNACYSHGQLNAVITVERTKGDTLHQTYHVACKRDIGPDIVVDVVESK